MSLRRVRFNDQCTMKGHGWFHGFHNSEYGPLAVIEISEAEEGSKGTDGRPLRLGQVVTCSARSIDFIHDEETKSYGTRGPL